jgi:ribosomal protein L19E
LEKEKGNAGGKGRKRSSETGSRNQRNGGGGEKRGTVGAQEKEKIGKVEQINEMKEQKREKQNRFIVSLYFSLFVMYSISPLFKLRNSNEQQNINSCLLELSRDINFSTVWCRLGITNPTIYFTPLVVRNFK